MKFNWFVGIDVSKKTLDITVLKSNEKILFKQIEYGQPSFDNPYIYTSKDLELVDCNCLLEGLFVVLNDKNSNIL